MKNRDELIILHLSDTHFGIPDSRGEAARVTHAIIKAARSYEWVPDICIFSGDFAYSGKIEEFKLGQDWLQTLLSIWPNCRLFIVPGNHDVTRDRANIVLRQAYQDETKYAESREKLSKAEHLQTFFRWHSELTKVFGDRLLSSWDDPYGTSGCFFSQYRQINLIGLNTSLLSCTSDDDGKLVQDIVTLNKMLSTLGRNSDECVIAVGHHPLECMVEWNSEEVNTLLHQITGPHLYLHGHRHEQSALTLAGGVGSGLCVLEAGAAYQSSKWPQFFLFYKLKFKEREIEPAVFSFAPSSGKWIKDNSRSESFVAALPSVNLSFDQLSPLDDAESEPNIEKSRVHRKRDEESSTPPNWSAEEIREFTDRTELLARRVLDIAGIIHQDVKLKMDVSISSKINLYRHSSRIKKTDSIVSKILRNIAKGQSLYGVMDLDDICGFRYVTLFQKEVPILITAIMGAVFDIKDRNPIFRRDAGAKVTIHTSRQDEDPLSVVPLVKEALKPWAEKCNLEVRHRATGYSSIHIVLRHKTPRSPSDNVGMPVEFQLRSGLEEFWGHVDNQLRYALVRGKVNEAPLDKHLNVLKAQFDAMIQYVDIIKDTAENQTDLNHEKNVATFSNLIDQPESALSLSLVEEQLAQLSGLPLALLSSVKAAFDLWEIADASRQFGGDSDKFRKAADAFLKFTNGCPDLVGDKILSRTLAGIALRERAFMLLSANGVENLIIAESIYNNILREDKCDASVLLRLGQTHIELGNFDKATSFLNDAYSIATTLPEENSEKSRIYDFSSLSRAICCFRIFEDEGKSDYERAEAIKMAIESSLNVTLNGRNESARKQALNDLVYYCWEERHFEFIDASNRSLSEDDFQLHARDLISLLDKSIKDMPDFRHADTLTRVYFELGDFDNAVNAAMLVCGFLETAASERSQGKSLVSLKRYGDRWLDRVLESLKNRDERDSLVFAYRVINSKGPVT